MNIDFHLYGTYAAALIAGFNSDEAIKIANAAQMVDDFTEKVSSVSATATSMDNIICKYVIDNAAAILLKKANIPNNYKKSIKDMSEIWACFHFLPGILPPNITSDEIKDRESLRCGMGGTSFNSLIGHDSAIYGDLVKFGVGMHILADTYAHCGFSGLITRNPILQDHIWIIEDNEAKKLPIDLRVPFGVDKVLMGAFYMGHALAGHLPDISTAKVRYEWGLDKERKEFEKDNTEYFALAFSSLIQVMDKKRNYERPEAEKYYNKWYKNIRNWLEIQKQIKGGKFSYSNRYYVENDTSFKLLLDNLTTQCDENDKVLLSQEILKSEEVLKQYKEYKKKIETEKESREYKDFNEASIVIKTQLLSSIKNLENGVTIDFQRLIDEDFR